MDTTLKELETENTSADLSEMQDKYLTFFTDGQLFGIPIANVVQIVGMQEITSIPEFPCYAKGIINLRGEIIPVIDMRLRLGRMETDYNDRTCIIVVNINEKYFGFAVDEVDEVTDIPQEQISPPPKIGGAVPSQFLTGVAKVGNKIILSIDTAKILGTDEVDMLLSAAM